MRLKDKVFTALGRGFTIKSDRKLGSDGLCCPIDEVITVNPECENIPRSLIHEGVHAVLFSGGIFEALDNEKMCEVICEQVARAIDENFEIKWRRK